MNKIRFVLSAALISFLPAAALGQAGPGAGPPCGDAVCDQIIAQLQPNESIAAVNASFGTTTVARVASRDTYLLRVPPQVSTQAVQHWLTNDPRVAWAELNYIVVAPGGGTQSFFLSATVGEYQDQQAVHLIGVDHAQKWSTGAGQIVAVLDTGIDPHHPVFAGRIAEGGFNYIDGNRDFRDAGEGALVGHGTIVAGLIMRIAPDAHILPMRVLNADGVGTSFYVAQAIHDAVDRGATIINASLGTIRPSQVIAQAAQRAFDNGVLVVASAGNTDRSAPRFYPAAFAPVLSVAGTDVRDRKAEFSDYGVWIDMTAPAVDLAGPIPGDGYAFNSGNSLAAAVVSGSAALVRSQQPSLTPHDVGVRLKLACDDIDPLNPAYSGLLGSGRINVTNALIRQIDAVQIRR